MVTWVIGINGAIALALLLLAWRLVALRRSLQRVNGLLAGIEAETQRSLTEAQLSLAGGQQGLQQLGLGYRQASQQLKQVKQALLLLSWVQGYVGARATDNARQSGEKSRRRTS